MRNYYTHPKTEDELAEEKEKDDEHQAHIERVLATYRRLGTTPSGLLKMDYINELNK